MRVVALCLGLAGVTAAAYGSSGAMWSWLDKFVFHGIKITGSKKVGFHAHDVSGDRSSFDQDNYFGNGDQKYTDYTDLYIRGEKVLKYFNFETRLTNNRFGNPQDKRFTAIYDSKLFSTQIGDISAALHNTNPLVGFTKTMSGITGTLRFGHGYEMKMVGSDTKATARTIAIPGNNSSGPYYLPGGNIVDGSLTIRIDSGKVLTLGEDYTVDYQTGLLNFMKITVPATSAIEATYESYSFNAEVGSIYGASMMLPFSKRFSVELTGVQQKSKSQNGLMTRTERFYGYNDANSPYDLQYEPLIDATHPFTIKRLPAGNYLTLGIDYHFDAVLPFRFYTNYPIPSTDLLEVTYTPKPTANALSNGDKKIYGIAVKSELFKGATLSYDLGASSVSSLAGSMKGRAQQWGLNYKAGKLTFRAGFDDIPATYATVSTTGFQRNERGQQYSLGYDIGLGWTLRAGYSKSTISSPTYNSSGQMTDNPADSSTQNLALDWTGRTGSHLSFSHISNVFNTSSGDSDRTTDSARYSRKFGRLTTGIEFDRTKTTFAQSSSGLLDGTYDSLRVDSTWDANRWLGFTGTLGTNRTSGNQGTSKGRDVSFTMNATPNDKFNFHATVSDSSSGFYNYGGFGTGDGYGYGNGGFSGGGNGTNTPYVGTTSRGYSLTAHWQPKQKLSLDITHNRQMAQGDYQSNSESQTTSLTVGFNPKSWLRLNSMVSLQKSDFTGSTSNSNATMYTLGLAAGPIRRWAVTFDFQKMGSGSTVNNSQNGTTSYLQNTDSYFVRVLYDLARRQRLFFDSQSGIAGGYLASRSSNWGFGYEYQLTKFLSLVGAYRVNSQSNLDPSSSAYSYRARSFDVDIAFNF